MVKLEQTGELHIYLVASLLESFSFFFSLNLFTRRRSRNPHRTVRMEEIGGFLIDVRIDIKIDVGIDVKVIVIVIVEVIVVIAVVIIFGSFNMRVVTR